MMIWNSKKLLDLVQDDMIEHHLTPHDVLYVGDMDGHKTDWNTFHEFAEQVNLSKPLQRAYLRQLFIVYMEDGKEMKCPISDLLDEREKFDENHKNHQRKNQD